MQTDIVAGKCILDGRRVKRSLRRMAFQVAENNADESAIIIAGIVGNGETVAQKIVAELKQIIPVPIHSVCIHIDKKAPLKATVTGEEDFTGKIIIVVDDVSNTGRTLLYALSPFLEALPKKIQTLVLVERSHKLFAVQPDYVGLSVATTLQEHISVKVEGEVIEGAWLH